MSDPQPGWRGGTGCSEERSTKCHSILIETLRLEFSCDTDPKQAAESRMMILDMLAANKIVVMSYHCPVDKSDRRLLRLMIEYVGVALQG